MLKGFVLSCLNVFPLPLNLLKTNGSFLGSSWIGITSSSLLTPKSSLSLFLNNASLSMFVIVTPLCPYRMSFRQISIRFGTNNFQVDSSVRKYYKVKLIVKWQSIFIKVCVIICRFSIKLKLSRSKRRPWNFQKILSKLG